MSKEAEIGFAQSPATKRARSAISMTVRIGSLAVIRASTDRSTPSSRGERQLRQERDADAAASRTEVEDAPGMVSARGFPDNGEAPPRPGSRSRAAARASRAESEKLRPQNSRVAENASERLSGNTACRECGEAGRRLSQGPVGPAPRDLRDRSRKRLRRGSAPRAPRPKHRWRRVFRRSVARARSAG